MEQSKSSYIERQVNIPASEADIRIYGVLRGEYTQPLALLAPGLGGWMHDLLLFNASRYFEEQGIATLRLSFYGDSDEQRNIADFGVHTNARDIDAVVDYVRQQGATWVCAIGHSFGGMAIVYSPEQQFDAAVLWDPSHTDAYATPQARMNLEKDFVFVDTLGSYVSSKGPGYVLSRRIFDNFAPGSTAMAAGFTVNTLVINAEDSGKAMQRYGGKYASAIDATTQHLVLPNASHAFTENGAMERLYGLTTDWIKQNVNDQV